MVFSMQRLSNVTEDYIETYCADLEDMIAGMISVELTDSISRNFIEQMIPHHKMAIRMCEKLLCYTTNIPLQNIATGIIVEQEKSIRDMKEVLYTCSECTNDTCDIREYQACFRQITDSMFCEMEQACITNVLNANFIREMIPHHLGAIKMCRNVLRFPICKELFPITHSIIKMQQKGVKQLQRIYDCLERK